MVVTHCLCLPPCDSVRVTTDSVRRGWSSWQLFNLRALQVRFTCSVVPRAERIDDRDCASALWTFFSLLTQASQRRSDSSSSEEVQALRAAASVRIRAARDVSLRQLEFRVNQRLLSHGLRAWSSFHSRFGKAMEDAFVKQLEDAEAHEKVR